MSALKTVIETNCSSCLSLSENGLKRADHKYQVPYAWIAEQTPDAMRDICVIELCTVMRGQVLAATVVPVTG